MVRVRMGEPGEERMGSVEQDGWEGKAGGVWTPNHSQEVPTGGVGIPEVAQEAEKADQEGWAEG